MPELNEERLDGPLIRYDLRKLFVSLSLSLSFCIMIRVVEDAATALLSASFVIDCIIRPNDFKPPVYVFAQLTFCDKDM